MDTFWKNISRYPQFFISSSLGLILILLTPVKNLSKIANFRLALNIMTIFIIVFFYIVLIKMTGTSN